MELGYRVDMESLAFLVAIIVLVLVGSGIVALVIALRSPQKTWARVVATVAVVPAVAGGAWFASLDIGMGGRIIGTAVLCAGVAAVVRTWRRR